MDNETHWMDNLSLAFSVLVAGLAAAWLVRSGTFDAGFVARDNLTWYLIRASGITGYILITLSVLWGLALSSSAVKNWSPGPLTMVLHSTISWLGLLFGIAHAMLLMADKYFTYRLTDLVVPFVGPYRPFATGLGTLAFWILLVVTPSFALKKRLFSYRAWRTLHYLSYAAFILVTAHGLLTGTDATKLGFQVLFGVSVLLSVILLGYRIGVKQASGAKPNRGRAQSHAPVRSASASEAAVTPHSSSQAAD
jgi:sulfoxide reductase heme-binding subunit YedZ